MADAWRLLGGRTEPPREILQRLESGEAPGEVAAVHSLEAADLIGLLAHASLDGEGPTLVAGPPRRSGLAQAMTEKALEALLPDAPRPARLALAAALLQVHDFWDASHDAAQQADDLGERSFSAYWHGIAHRREPDADNATYWFRRVGRHPLFGPLGIAATPLLQTHGDPGVTARLLPGGLWDPYSFIDLCTGSRPASAVAGLARSLQRIELILLLEATAAVVLPRRP